MFFTVYKIPQSLNNKIKCLNMFSNDEMTFIKEGHSFKGIINNAEIDIRLLSNFLFIKGKNSMDIHKTPWILDEIFDDLFDDGFLNFMPYTNQEKRLFLAMDNVEIYYNYDGEITPNFYQKYLRDDLDYDKYRFSHAIIKKDGVSFNYTRKAFNVNEENEEDVKKLYEKFF